MATGIDIAFPLVIGTDLYPMENLGGCRCEEGHAQRGQGVSLCECTFERGEIIRSQRRAGAGLYGRSFPAQQPH